MGYGRVVLLLAGLTLLLGLAACAPQEAPSGAAPAAANEAVAGTWVTVETDGDAIALSRSLVEQNVNTHFTLEAGGRELAFMAYVLGDELLVRANACPPCRSRGFTLVGAVLDCDTCHTTFDARDGSGLQGACVDYPKAGVSYRVVDDSVVMTLADLVQAYDETLVAG